MKIWRGAPSILGILVLHISPVLTLLCKSQCYSNSAKTLMSRIY